MNSQLRNLVSISDGKTKRSSSWDRSGGNRDFVRMPAGATQTIAEIQGPATINHFYVTLVTREVFAYRRIVIRMYWDHETTPSVEVPIGDFFGVPFSHPRFFSSHLLSVNPGRSIPICDGLNTYFPMPFAKHARIEIFNDSEWSLNNIWFHLDYEENTPVDDALGYFHACWRRDNPCKRIIPPGMKEEDVNLSSGLNTTGDDNYVILDATGRGNYAGCLLQIDNQHHYWYGEGDDMIFIDDDTWPPSIHGTGTEEIFGGGACPDTPYHTPYCGVVHVENPNDFYGQTAMYRLNVHDPVRFQKSIRVTIEHGHANNLENDYASVAYWYQQEPHAPNRALPPGLDRIPRRTDSLRESEEKVSKAGRLFTGLESRSALLHHTRHALRDLFMETKLAITDRNESLASELAARYLSECEKVGPE